MPPRPSPTTLTIVVNNGPILPFLYPASTRRLLSSTSSLRQDDINKEFKSILANLPRSSQPKTLPPLPSSFDSSSAPGLPSRDWANSIQREARAFKDLGEMNKGISSVLQNIADETERRKELEESLGERINSDIYRYTSPIVPGGYVAPKDLSFEEYQKFIRTRRFHIRKDLFETIQENPLNHYKNFNLLKDFMTSAGRIRHRSITGLSNTNQRKLSKAIRRAIGIGLMPSVYRHPELLKREQSLSNDGYKPQIDNPYNDKMR